MDIDEIMARLERGDTLLIHEQLRAYISMESNDTPDRFVMQCIRDTDEREALSKEETPQYDVSRHRSLAEALLSLMDWKWQGNASGKKAATKQWIAEHPGALVIGPQRERS